VESARRLPRLRYLPFVRLAVVSLSCVGLSAVKSPQNERPSLCARSRAIPTIGRGDVPRGGGVGGIFCSLFVLTGGYLRIKKNLDVFLI
jgi:hypothetical protein